MRRNYRLAGYLLAVAVLVGLMAVSPAAWATPDQSQHNQTVPTRTPKPAPPTEPPPQPTAPPQPTTPPQPTAAPVTATPAPRITPTAVAATPTASHTAAVTVAGDALSLAIDASPLQAWSGVKVICTLTLINRSADTVRKVVLLDPLPAGLEPGALYAEIEASWQGRTLRAETATLAPGEQLTVIFEAIVGANVAPGAVILNQVTASAAGVAQIAASATIALPPAELPRVGGRPNAE